METVEILQAKVSSLDVASLDQVEARLQSVLGKVNEIAKHKATVEDADTQSKVHQLYEIVQRWSPLASTLPEVVQRLIMVRQLHEQGITGTAGFRLLEAFLDLIILKVMIGSPYEHVPQVAQVQKTMKENLAAVEDNFASIDARMQKLAK
ncbi:hypothetical protein JD844_010744 [Phrynosoma platyrhinos]|uniref:Dynactin subunit 2 n=1 Tax=Phrynosoma platyrhinos TaxID=52577 RepID=A0ABQ7THQ6_PHRPL|nr:hypothetical protein JD844_010744 [Phrynosoma platyrhinos]